MSETQRSETLALRRAQKHPKHSPPHFNNDTTNRYLFTAACFNHRRHINRTSQRITTFEQALLREIESGCRGLFAWVILPNHYHFLAACADTQLMCALLGKLHGRTSRVWNKEDNRLGRKVWFRSTETAMKSDRHFWATLNYIHNNPVKHGYVEKWQDWPYSSAANWLKKVGAEEAKKIWLEYPVLNYGKGWDG